MSDYTLVAAAGQKSDTDFSLDVYLRSTSGGQVQTVNLAVLQVPFDKVQIIYFTRSNFVVLAHVPSTRNAHLFRVSVPFSGAPVRQNITIIPNVDVAALFKEGPTVGVLTAQKFYSFINASTITVSEGSASIEAQPNAIGL